jgi:hypothetical protein
MGLHEPGESLRTPEVSSRVCGEWSLRSGEAAAKDVVEVEVVELCFSFSAQQLIPSLPSFRILPLVTIWSRICVCCISGADCDWGFSGVSWVRCLLVIHASL